MNVVFTKHAIWKFSVLKKFNLTQDQIVMTVKNPEFLDVKSRTPLKIAQSTIDDEHVLRVIYIQETERIVIITFYPGRKSQYAR